MDSDDKEEQPDALHLSRGGEKEDSSGGGGSKEAGGFFCLV